MEKRVSLDETGTTTAMTRLFGRAPPGQRVIDSVPQNNWQMTTVIVLLLKTSSGAIPSCAKKK